MFEFKQEYDQNDFELIERERCYKGFFSLEKFKFRHKRFDGSWTGEVHREVFIRGSATCVLPYDPNTGKVVLLEQFRAGALLEDQTPWLIELVAGIDDPGETPEQVAIREAQEEAGLDILDLEPMLTCFPSPGGATEKIRLFCARVSAEGVGGIYGLPEENEDIKVHVFDLNNIPDLLDKGIVCNAPAIMALQWLLLNRDKLDHKWL